MNSLKYLFTALCILGLTSCGSDDVKPDKTGIQPIKLEYNKSNKTEQPAIDEGNDSQDPKMSEEERLKRAAEINAELGIGYLRRGDIEKADFKLSKAYKQNSESVSVNLGLALLNERLKYVDKAEKFFLQAVKYEGKERAASAHNNYARFLCTLGRYQQADQFFKIAFANKLYQQREISYTNAGYCAFLSKNYDRAIEYYRQALSYNRIYAPALLNMSKLFIAKDQIPLAKAYMDRYAVVGPKTPDALITSYKIEKALGNSAEATTLFNTLKNNYPDSKQTHDAYMLEYENSKNK